MKKEDLDISGCWIELVKLTQFLSERNIKELCKGQRDNKTDGEWHRIFLQTDSGITFESHGNVYDSKTFIPLIEWADRYSKSSEDLKPCPFCGNEDIVIDRIYINPIVFDSSPNKIHIGCGSCGLVGYTEDTEDGGDEESIIEAWNRRI